MAQTAPAAETTIPVTDEGFLRGDGAFEVIRVYDGQPFALDEHFETGRRLGSPSRRSLMEERVRVGFVTYAPTRVLDGVKSLGPAGPGGDSRLLTVTMI